MAAAGLASAVGGGGIAAGSGGVAGTAEASGAAGGTGEGGGGMAAAAAAAGTGAASGGVGAAARVVGGAGGVLGAGQAGAGSSSSSSKVPRRRQQRRRGRGAAWTCGPPSASTWRVIDAGVCNKPAVAGHRFHTQSVEAAAAMQAWLRHNAVACRSRGCRLAAHPTLGPGPLRPPGGPSAAPALPGAPHPPWLQTAAAPPAAACPAADSPPRRPPAAAAAACRAGRGRGGAP